MPLKRQRKLKGVLQRISGYAVNEDTLRGLIILFSDTHFTRPTYNGEPVHLGAKDILGHVYEYFLGRFAQAEGKRGGQYFTPKSIVSLIVEMLEPYSGRVYDQPWAAAAFRANRTLYHRPSRQHQQRFHLRARIQPHHLKLAAMNMAIRGIDYDFGKYNADSFTQPQHIDKRWISSWQTHHSTSAIGGANPLPMIHVGHTARRLKATPTSLGCNT